MQCIQDTRILIVDDNRDLLLLIEEKLAAAGYSRIRTADCMASAQNIFSLFAPELVILDINLPDGDGFSLFKKFRKLSDVPILFLSARDADADRLYGLGLGADDYMTKPFLTQELLLRIQTILRRFYRAELQRNIPILLGNCSVNLNDAVVHRDGLTLPLTATERLLLQKLADERGHIVTFDALCQTVWGDGYYGYENSLNVHIRHLREKIEAEPSKPVWLLTVRGIGYKLRKEDTR